MITRRFGRTELALPVFSCGGMRYQQSWRAADPVTERSQQNLQATIDRALELGINHIETARGYGTSEAQLGQALSRHARSSFVLQTKVAPKADPAEFEKQVLESFERLRVDYVDLFAFHGLNNRETLDWTLRPGGCFEVIERLRAQGRIRHVGFSTHGSCALICEAIDSDRFDYVNLHYYYIFQENLPAVLAARRHDMGLFIISPSDKGGRLQAPTETLKQLCRPVSPMVANDLFCLARPDVHTLSLGAARPSDFDEHLKVLPLLADPKPVLDPIIARLDGAYAAAVGDSYAATYLTGVPEWDAIPGGINVRMILSLYNLVHAYGVIDYARERYSNLNGHDIWVPGSPADKIDDKRLVAALPDSPHRHQIPELLRKAHALLSR